MGKVLLNPLEKAKSDLSVLEYLIAKHLNADSRNKFISLVEIEHNEEIIYTQSIQVVIYNPFDYYTVILKDLKKTDINQIAFDSNYEQMNYQEGMLWIEQKDEKSQYKIKVYL